MQKSIALLVLGLLFTVLWVGAASSTPAAGVSEPTEDSPGEALPEGEEAPAGSEDGTIELEIPQNDAKEVLDLCRIECRVAWIDCKETCGCTWCCKDCDASYQACLANCP